jgi:predicted nucleic acid-binding protein
MDAHVVVDASVWVSWLQPFDANHDASRFWVERYIAEGGLLVAPALVLVEVAAAIARRTGQPLVARETIKNLYKVSALRLLSFHDRLIWVAVEVAADLRLRTGDAVYVAVARRHNIPLISWDKKQLRKASSQTTTYTPDEYPF